MWFSLFLGFLGLSVMLVWHVERRPRRFKTPPVLNRTGSIEE